MFITVTRFGGPATLRVAASAVAYIGEMPGGAVLHLLSGEYMRVDETAADIEQAVCAALSPELVTGELLPAESPVSLSLIEEQLATIVDRLGAHGLGARESLRAVVDEAIRDASFVKQVDEAKMPTEAVDQTPIDKEALTASITQAMAEHAATSVPAPAPAPAGKPRHGRGGRRA